MGEYEEVGNSVAEGTRMASGRGKRIAVFLMMLEACRKVASAMPVASGRIWENWITGRID